MGLDDVARIYAQEYWNPCVCPALPSGLDYFVFDMAVMNGRLPTITDLQKVAGAEPDGKIGQKTIDAINSHSPGELIIELSRGRLQFLSNLSRDSWHGVTWRSRIIRATREALNMGAFV